MTALAEYDRLTLVFIVSILIALITACSFMWYLLHLSLERVKDFSYKSRLDFVRFVFPAIASLMLMVKTADIRLSLWNHAVWILFLGVVLPFWLIWASLKEVLHKRLERVIAILTMILLIDACLVTAGWAYAKRSESKQYYGPARIVDYFPSTRSSNLMKVNVEWECYDGQNRESYCHDNQIVNCNDNFSGSERRSVYDYDMTIYNSDSFISCQDGFDQDVWKMYRWNHWRDDDFNNEEEWDDDNYENNQKQSPYMMIRGDCNTCEIDRHSAGNFLRAKRNYLAIPLWVLTCLGVGFTAFCFVVTQRQRQRMEQRMKAQQTSHS